MRGNWSEPENEKECIISERPALQCCVFGMATALTGWRKWPEMLFKRKINLSTLPWWDIMYAFEPFHRLRAGDDTAYK